jgi:hypothetical protein
MGVPYRAERYVPPLARPGSRSPEAAREVALTITRRHPTTTDRRRRRALTMGNSRLKDG